MEPTPQAIVLTAGFSLGPYSKYVGCNDRQLHTNHQQHSIFAAGVPGNVLSLTADDQGDLIGYYVNSSFINAYPPTLNMWNSTRCINLAIPNSYGGPPVADNWLWRPTQGLQVNFSLGIQWSAPLATNIAGRSFARYSYAIGGIDSGVVYMTAAASSGGLFYQPGWQIEAGYSATYRTTAMDN